MGTAQAGSLNTKGFTSSISQGVLPKDDHITYSGSFNQQYYDIGPKAKYDLQLNYGLSVSNSPIEGDKLKQKNYFIGIFNKSNMDGEKRTSFIHAVIVLDVSGSMAGSLVYKTQSKASRLDLAKQAIKLFYKKLKKQDIFSLVIFNNNAQTIVASTYVQQLDQQTVIAIVDGITSGGGTTLQSGFLQAQKNLTFNNSNQEMYQKRIIMLTDVGDNSLATENSFVQKLKDKRIHTTIIGVSSDFKSQTCQKLKNIKGFNYFCATQESDLKLHLYDHFDYTFFPTVFDIQISIITQDIRIFDVYGTPDEESVRSYNNMSLKNNNNFIITKMNSSFPSDLKYQNGKYLTQGGLILLKFIPKNRQSNLFKGTIELKYKKKNGEQVKRQYVLNYKFEKQQFHTNETMQKSVRAFYYAYCLKQTLSKINSPQNKLTDYKKSKYIQNLQHIKQLGSENQKKDIDNFIKLIQKYQNNDLLS